MYVFDMHLRIVNCFKSSALLFIHASVTNNKMSGAGGSKMHVTSYVTTPLAVRYAPITCFCVNCRCSWINMFVAAERLTSVAFLRVRMRATAASRVCAVFDKLFSGAYLLTLQSHLVVNLNFSCKQMHVLLYI